MTDTENPDIRIVQKLTASFSYTPGILPKDRIVTADSGSWPGELNYTLHVTNDRESVTFKTHSSSHPDATHPDATNYHLLLEIPKKLLEDPEALKPSSSKWKCKYDPTQVGESYIFYFLYIGKGDLTLNKAHPVFSIIVDNLVAPNDSLGDKKQIEVSFNNECSDYISINKLKPGMLQNANFFATVVNAETLPPLPITAQWVGQNRVINDGDTKKENKLTLRLENPLPKEKGGALELNQSTQIKITVPVGDKSNPINLVPTDDNWAQEVEVDLTDSANNNPWQLESGGTKSTLGNDGIIQLKPNKATSMSGQSYIDIELSSIQTNCVDGISYLHIQMTGFPGYQPNALYLPVEKTHAGSFFGLEGSNSPAIQAKNNGTGEALFAQSSKDSSTIYAKNNGTGQALFAYVGSRHDHPTNYGSTIYTQNDTNGHALYAYNYCDSSTIVAQNNGTGQALNAYVGYSYYPPTTNHSSTICTQNDKNGQALYAENNSLSSATIWAKNNSTGQALYAESKTSGSDATIEAHNSGTGRALYAENESSDHATIWAKNNSISQALYAESKASDMGGVATIEAHNSGTGRALYAENESSDHATIWAKNNSISHALYAESKASDMGGVATIDARNSGTGRALFAESVGDDCTIYAENNGTGRALQAKSKASSDNPYLESATFYAGNSGTGQAIYAENESSGCATIWAKNNSTSQALYAESKTSGNDATIEAHNSGTGRALFARSVGDNCTIFAKNIGTGRALYAENSSSEYATIRAYNSDGKNWSKAIVAKTNATIAIKSEHSGIHADTGYQKSNLSSTGHFLEHQDLGKLPHGCCIAINADGAISPVSTGDRVDGLVISSYHCGLVGNHPQEWPKKHLRDQHGQLRRETRKQPVMVEKTETVTKQRPKNRTEKYQREYTDFERETDPTGQAILREVKKTEEATREVPVYETLPLLNADNEKIGEQQVPVMEEYEETVTVNDQQGQAVMVESGEFEEIAELVVHPEYNADKDYIPRNARPEEWSCVVLHGLAIVPKGSVHNNPCEIPINWRCLNADYDDDNELWLLK